jgi:putative transposase
MPRPPRVFVDGAIYHIYCRTGRGEHIFRDDEEADALIDILRDVKRRDDIAILAWCLMSNHYHLVVRTARVPLWRSMRLVQGRFAKGYNRRHEVYGSVWQGRYKAMLVQPGGYLYRVIAYVHLNPVAAGVVTDPIQYPRSGHREILGSGGGEALVDVDEVLSLFGESRAEGVRAYLSTLPTVARSRWGEGEPETLPWWKGAVADGRLTIRERPRLDALGASSEPAVAALAVDDFVVAAANALGVEVGQIAGPRSGHELTRAREMMAVLAVERYRIRVSDLAERLARSPSVVSRWVSTAGSRRASNEEFRGRLAQLAVDISSRATSPAPLAEASEESEFISGLDRGFVD